jgi:hypothetical protein
VYDAGCLKAGATTSPEMIVWIAESLLMTRRFAVREALDAETPA